MGPQEFSEKLSELLSSLDEIAEAGERVKSQMEVEDLFSRERDVDAVRCNCGLVLSGLSLYQHLKESRHETLTAESYSPRRMPEASNLKIDQKKVRQSSLPARKREQKRRKMVKTAPKSVGPVSHFSFSNNLDYDEP